MQNKTSVLNTALVRVGARMGNAGFQDTPAMQVAGAVYDKCRTLCLSLYPWSFALRRQRLALSAEAVALRLRSAVRQCACGGGGTS